MHLRQATRKFGNFVYMSWGRYQQFIYIRTAAQFQYKLSRIHCFFLCGAEFPSVRHGNSYAPLPPITLFFCNIKIFLSSSELTGLDLQLFLSKHPGHNGNIYVCFLKSIYLSMQTLLQASNHCIS